MFNQLSNNELINISGGKGWGWVGLAEPIFDFCKGVGEGWSDASNNDK